MPHKVGKYTHMLVMQKFSIQLGQGLDAALEFFTCQAVQRFGDF